MKDSQSEFLPLPIRRETQPLTRPIRYKRIQRTPVNRPRHQGTQTKPLAQLERQEQRRTRASGVIPASSVSTASIFEGVPCSCSGVPVLALSAPRRYAEVNPTEILHRYGRSMGSSSARMDWWAVKDPNPGPAD